MIQRVRLVAAGKLRGFALRIGALFGYVLTVAGAIDVDADGVHHEALKDCRSDDGISETAAPIGQLDV